MAEVKNAKSKIQNHNAKFKINPEINSF